MRGCQKAAENNSAKFRREGVFCGFFNDVLKTVDSLKSIENHSLFANHEQVDIMNKDPAQVAPDGVYLRLFAPCIRRIGCSGYALTTARALRESSFTF